LIKPRITTNIHSSYRRTKVYSKNKNSGEYLPKIQYLSTPPTTSTYYEPPNTIALPPPTTNTILTYYEPLTTPIVCSDSEYISNYNELLESNYNPSNITGTDTSVIPNCVSISKCLYNQYISKLPDLVTDSKYNLFGKYKSNLQCTNVSQCN
jgi:hypothetical protein